MFQRLLLIFVLVGGCTAGQLKTFVLPTVETHPEERQVADKHPVIPVLIEKIDSLYYQYS